MARVFIESTRLAEAVAAREAVLADDHEVEMIETAAEVESRLGAPDEEVALILTRPPGHRESRRMVGLFSARIPRPPILLLAEAGSPEERQRLARETEADECLPLPPEAAEVQVVLQQQLERFRLQLATGIIGRGLEIREVLERIHLIAPVHSTVLITGESGTGKELAARAIHRLSPRRTRPFIAVNCAAIPESLLESELFGHEKGAFTGATSRRRGMFELADGGTLLLDEIAEMPLPLQTRLLRVLEARRFMRVGGDEEIEVNVRVIAATNHDLRDAVRRGAFRRDLFYRLNVLHLELPPLRDRAEDISVLVRRFIREFSEAHDREFRGLDQEAMAALLRYSWPGNVRELRNLIESMVVLAPGSVIRAEDIPQEIRSGSGRALLPVRAGGVSPDHAVSKAEEIAPPQLEFIFRTLVELKIDLEDLRQEFDRYRDGRFALESGTGKMEDGRYRPAIEIGTESGGGPDRDEVDREASPAVESREDGAEGAGDSGLEAETAALDGPPIIPFRVGMSMSELEREAIRATLVAVEGNRRKAAERLQIGERTLYRKLRQYKLDL